MQHIIIFDSVDRTGKTEMSIELSKRLEIPRFKNQRESKFFQQDPGYFVKALRYGDPYFCSYLKQTGASVILDRSYPSEFVYSQAFNRKTDWDILRLVDTLYAELGTRIVIPYRNTYAGLQDDQFKQIDSNMLSKLDELYVAFSEWTSCHTLRLCVDDEDINREMEEIRAWIQ